MILLPIDIEEAKNKQFLNTPDCLPVLEVYPSYYQRIGFNKPWIGYFASTDGVTIVGAAGFKGKPKDAKIEIAYGTFKAYEGQGMGTEICRHLVQLALHTDPAVRITARTLLDGHASMAILRKNGFECLGIIYDEEDGDVFEWEFIKSR